MNRYASDLVLLVADSDMEAVVNSLLKRHDDLGIRTIKWTTYVHRDHDPACFGRGHDFLRPFANRYAHGLVMFDKKGSGRELKPREDLEATVRKLLSENGWGDRADAIVIDPELEQWAWNTRPEVSQCLGWQGSQVDLRNWLRDKGMWPEKEEKPRQPKSAFRETLKHVHRRPSPAIFDQLAQSASFEGCRDSAFRKFKKTLQCWFPK